MLKYNRSDYRITLLASLAVLLLTGLLHSLPAAAAASGSADEAAVANLSPGGKAVFQNCSNQSLKTYYSCSCLGMKAEALVPEAQQKRLTEIEKRQARAKKAIASLKADSKMTDEQKGARISHIQAGLDRLDQEHANIENAADWDKRTANEFASTLLFRLTKAGECHRPEGIRAQEFKSCMAGTNPLGKTDDAEYCHCIGDAAAKFWMKPGGPTGSQALGWIRQNAWKECAP